MKTLNNNNKKLISLHVLCGGGISTDGYKKAGYTPILGMDLDKTALDVFQKNIKPLLGMHQGDFTKFDWEGFKKDLAEKMIEIDVLEIGLVCCTFSPSFNGDRKNDVRTYYYQDLAQIVQILKPKVVQIEQSGMIPSFRFSKEDEKGSFMNEFFNYFLSLNPEYEITWKKIDCRNFGLAQSRQRWICIASRIGEIQIPEGDVKRENWAQVKDIESKTLSEQDKKDNLFLKWAKIEKLEAEAKAKSSGGSWIRNHLTSHNGHTITAHPYGSSRDKAVIVDEEKEIARNYTRDEMRKAQGIYDEFDLDGVNKTNFGKIVGNAFPSKVAFEIAQAIKAKILEFNERSHEEKH